MLAMGRCVLLAALALGEVFALQIQGEPGWLADPGSQKPQSAAMYLAGRNESDVDLTVQQALAEVEETYWQTHVIGHPIMKISLYKNFKKIQQVMKGAPAAGIFTSGVMKNGVSELNPNWKVEAPYMFDNKDTALIEKNLTCSELSLYAANAPKFPQWLLQNLSALKSEVGSAKTRTYNFVGGAKGDGIKQLEKDQIKTKARNSRRVWVDKFAINNFGSSDWLEYTDAPNNSHDQTLAGKAVQRKKYVPLGPYDHTLDGQVHNVTKYARYHKFDASYWRAIIESKFTLCPGGDEPWSMRFLDAIAGGSIPVIKTYGVDLNSTAYWFRDIGYKFFTTDEVVNMNIVPDGIKGITDHNYKLFLKYQTFAEGDNVPPKYAAYKTKCFENGVCRQFCEHFRFAQYMTHVVPAV